VRKARNVLQLHKVHFDGYVPAQAVRHVQHLQHPSDCLGPEKASRTTLEDPRTRKPPPRN